MKQINNPIICSFAAAAVIALLSADLCARAAVISVNLTDFATDAQQIDEDETFGIASQSSVVGGWVNLNRNLAVSSLPFSDGVASTVNLTGTQPNGFGSCNGAYTDTPLIGGIDDYTGTANPTSVTLANLVENFPSGYKVIAYVSGFNGNTGASISDGTSKFYYQTLNNPAAEFTGSLTQTTATTDAGNGLNPFAQYAVFGESVLLTNDTLTLTLDTLYGGGSILGGFQIVGVGANEVTARIWKGNLSSDWDTSTLNWTNVVYGATNFVDGDPVYFTDASVAASPTVNLTSTRSPGNLTVDSTKNYTFTGNDIAGTTGLTKKGAGSLTLNNINTYAGNTVINAGILKVGVSGAIPDGAGKGDVAVTSGATFDLNGVSEGINGLGGSGTVDNTGNAATLTVSLDAEAATFPGTLQGALALTKQGTNALTLTGTSSHTGATTVGHGTLVLNQPLAFSTSSALEVSNGASLEVTFTNGTGLFSSSSVSFNGGIGLTVDYGDASYTAYGIPITTFGSLNLNGVTQIGIRGQNFGVGSFTIISYGSKTGSGSFSSTPAFLPSGMVATIQDTGSAVNLMVATPSVQTLLWTAGDGEWSTNGLFNWNFGTAEYKEYPSGFGDIVSFDNSNYGTVTLAHDVRPFSVTVAGNYVLTGKGRITGSTGITRSGYSGTTFILDNTNTYAGVTTISEGTLEIHNASALGSTAGETMVLPGGSLALGNGITLSRELLVLSGDGVSGNNGALRSVDTNSPVTVASDILLGGNARIRAQDGELIVNSAITDNGSNYMVTLHAAGNTSIVRMNSSSNVVDRLRLYGWNLLGARIVFGADNTFPGSRLVVGGGTHDLAGTDQQFLGISDGSGPQDGVLTNSSASPATLTITGTNEVGSVINIAGLLNVVKSGAGRQGLNGNNSHSGTTTVSEGILRISGDSSGATNAWIVSGGSLEGAGTIGGPVSVGVGGTLAPGTDPVAISTLTINNSLSLSGNVIIGLNKDVSPSNDVVNVAGALTYGGTLTVTNVGGRALVVGDTFQVFPAGGTGSFSSVISEPGITLNFTDGVITVVSVGAGPTLNYTPLGGGVIRFDWTGAYKLQWQTNTLSVGLNSNWENYPDTSNPVNVTNNPAIPASFFRLKSL